MKIIIAGGREYFLTATDIQALDRLMLALPITEVVCGMARGADLDGKLWAQYCGIRYKEFPPDWERYGKQAGFIRNQEMADHADGAVLFPGGRGTADMKLRSMKTFPADRIFDFTGGTGLF